MSPVAATLEDISLEWARDLLGLPPGIAGSLTTGATMANDVVINQVLVSFGTPEKTRAVIERIQQEGICWCGATVRHGHTAMRISVSSWATTEADVEASLAAILSAAAS